MSSFAIRLPLVLSCSVEGRIKDVLLISQLNRNTLSGLTDRAVGQLCGDRGGGVGVGWTEKRLCWKKKANDEKRKMRLEDKGVCYKLSAVGLCY